MQAAGAVWACASRARVAHALLRCGGVGGGGQCQEVPASVVLRPRLPLRCQDWHVHNWHSADLTGRCEVAPGGYGPSGPRAPGARGEGARGSVQWRRGHAGTCCEVGPSRAWRVSHPRRRAPSVSRPGPPGPARAKRASERRGLCRARRDQWSNKPGPRAAGLPERRAPRRRAARGPGRGGM